MENKRIEFFQYLSSPAVFDNPPVDYGYPEFKKKYFTSAENLEKLYDYCVSHQNNDDEYIFSSTLQEFYKLLVCDLEWAKDTEYCKVTPEPPKPGTTILVTDQSEKLKKFENYPCLTSSNRCKLYSVVDDVQGLIYYMGCTNSETGQFAKYYDDGLVIVYDVVVDNTGKRILKNAKQTTYKCPEVKADEVQPE